MKDDLFCYIYNIFGQCKKQQAIIWDLYCHLGLMEPKPLQYTNIIQHLNEGVGQVQAAIDDHE